MLRYSQSKGHLFRDGLLIGLGYAGNGEGLNNPADQAVRNVGPLPQGLYTLKLRTDTKLGPRVFALEPDPANAMFGRSEFFIHWDNSRQNFSASEGCIVLVTTQTFNRLNDGDRLTVTE